MGEPCIEIVRNGASPPPGKPRTNTLAPDSPPELSTQTPGMALNKSAVDWVFRHSEIPNDSEDEEIEIDVEVLTEALLGEV